MTHQGIQRFLPNSNATLPKKKKKKKSPFFGYVSKLISNINVHTHQKAGKRVLFPSKTAKLKPDVQG